MEVRAQDVENIANEKPVGLNGAITASLTGYSAGGIEERRKPFSWTVAGSPVLSLYGVQMPFNFILSEQERDFRQPFNQFGVSPTYKTVTAHLGYRSMTISRYGLAGVTFLGGGFEANPSVIRLAGMYGRLQRAIDDDSADFSVQPAYQRMGYAAKLGFGDNSNFVDFSYLHAKDDSTSLTKPIFKSFIYPQENAVLGMTGKFTIIEPLTLEFDGGASALTRDLRAPQITSNKIPGFISNFIDLKSSSSLAFAGRADLNLHLTHFGARLGYEVIEPDYTSLGAYYFNTDIVNITLAPTFDLLDSKVRVSGSIGLQHDNVLGNKLAQTSRVIGSGSISYNPSQTFGLDLQYTNYSTGQDAGTKPINDSIRVRNVSQSASFAPRYMILGDEENHIFSLVGTLQDYTDLNAFTNLFSNSKSVTASLNYMLSMLKSGRSIGGSILFANTQTSQISTHIFGGSLNGSLNYFENKLTFGGSLGYTRNIISSLSVASGTFSETLSAAYQLSPEDNFSFSLYGSQNTSSQFQPQPYQELTTTLSYTRTFSF